MTSTFRFPNVRRMLAFVEDFVVTSPDGPVSRHPAAQVACLCAFPVVVFRAFQVAGYSVTHVNEAPLQVGQLVFVKDFITPLGTTCVLHLLETFPEVPPQVQTWLAMDVNLLYAQLMLPPLRAKPPWVLEETAPRVLVQGDLAEAMLHVSATLWVNLSAAVRNRLVDKCRYLALVTEPMWVSWVVVHKTRRLRGRHPKNYFKITCHIPPGFLWRGFWPQLAPKDSQVTPPVSRFVFRTWLNHSAPRWTDASWTARPHPFRVIYDTLPVHGSPQLQLVSPHVSGRVISAAERARLEAAPGLSVVVFSGAWPVPPAEAGLTVLDPSQFTHHRPLPERLPGGVMFEDSGMWSATQRRALRKLRCAHKFVWTRSLNPSVVLHYIDEPQQNLVVPYYTGLIFDGRVRDCKVRYLLRAAPLPMPPTRLLSLTYHYREILVTTWPRVSSPAIWEVRMQEFLTLPRHPTHEALFLLRFRQSLRDNAFVLHPTGGNQRTPPSDEVCCICTDEWTCPVKLVRCGHTFCARCISQWFETHRKCPVCRTSYADVDHINVEHEELTPETQLPSPWGCANPESDLFGTPPMDWEWRVSPWLRPNTTLRVRCWFVRGLWLDFCNRHSVEFKSDVQFTLSRFWQWVWETSHLLKKGWAYDLHVKLIRDALVAGTVDPPRFTDAGIRLGAVSLHPLDDIILVDDLQPLAMRAYLGQFDN